MRQICKYNPLSDVEEVQPALAVDISEVMATNTVVSTGDSSPYSKETDISEVGHYLRDKIDTAMAAYRLQASMASQIADKSVNTPTPNGV